MFKRTGSPAPLTVMKEKKVQPAHKCACGEVVARGTNVLVLNDGKKVVASSNFSVPCPSCKKEVKLGGLK